MPLLDNFHPPLSQERHWESFHASWANEIMATLNQGVLPPGYFAETQVHFGNRVEIDVATMEEAGQSPVSAGGNGGVAVADSTSTEVLIMPAVFPDSIEVQVFEESGGASVVGAIELVSPANKDRAEARLAYAAKCAACLQSKIGLIVIDVVTQGRANLRNELIALLKQNDALLFPSGPALYAAAYRPLRTETHGDIVEMRLAGLDIGATLPTLPLALRRGPVISIDFDFTYENARRRSNT